LEALENGCTSPDTQRVDRRTRNASCGTPYAVGAGRTRGPLSALHAIRAVNAGRPRRPLSALRTVYAGRTRRPLSALRPVNAGRPHGSLRTRRALCSGCSGLVPLELSLAGSALARVVDDPNSTVARVVAGVNDAVRVGNLSESDGSRKRPRYQNYGEQGNSYAAVPHDAPSVKGKIVLLRGQADSPSE
jgi:hypothetical protein